MTGPSTARSANQGDQVRARSHQHFTEWTVGDAVEDTFHLTRDARQVAVYVGGLRMRPSDQNGAFDYEFSQGNTIVFTAPPAAVDIAFDVTT